MAGAITTLKIGPDDHQALVALLKYQARKITEAEFKAILSAQGRKVEGYPTQDLIAGISEMLIGAVS